MQAFQTLPLCDQAVLVLVQLLEDVVHNKRTGASVEYPIAELFNLVSSSFDVAEREVRLVADAVAKSGVRMLPSYVEETRDDESVANVHDTVRPRPATPVI